MNASVPLSIGRHDQRVLGLAFFLLFPGFFFYHTLLGTGASGAFLGGYFTPISLLCAPALALIYLRNAHHRPVAIGHVDLHFGIYLAYFCAVVAANAATGANRAITVNHLLGILFLVNIFVLFRHLDFASAAFRRTGMACLAAMTTIALVFSIDGVFYLGALGIAKDADSLATYQGFSRSYLVTYLAVVAFTAALPLRLLLHAAGAVTLFVNTARSEFVALLFAVPIIEFYYSRHKLLFVLAVLAAAALLHLYLEQLLAALPDNRILELLDLSQSTSANKRHHLTLYALHTLRSHPLLGSYASYQPGYYAHNILSAWVDLGLAGLLYLSALMLVPASALLLYEWRSRRRRGSFMLGFSLACVTVLLLLTSHYFTDMLIGATLGACAQYFYERKYVTHRPSHVSPSPARHADLLQAMPHARSAGP